MCGLETNPSLLVTRGLFQYQVKQVESKTYKKNNKAQLKYKGQNISTKLVRTDLQKGDAI
jgi:hypothetical protein